MGVEHQVAVGHGLEPSFDQLVQGDQVPLRFAHALLLAEHQKLAVQPVAYEGFARHRLGLGDLVAVMHGDMVRTARVNIEARAQVLHGHGRTFHVPAGKTHAPGTLPFHLPP